jgi:prepilin-type N-terminal cleavage/methylation domain-containing protein
MRRGFSTVELIVVLVVAGVLSAAIATLLRRQQRFYTRAARLVEHRVSLRDATSILPAELRALSPSGGDVLVASDSSLEIRATIGAGIACNVAVGGTAVTIAPVATLRGTALAAFSTSPQPGDVALVFDAGAPDDSLDDRWTTRDVASVDAIDANCPSPLDATELAGQLASQLRFGIGSPLAPSVRPGTFVHVVRRVRYRLYRAGTGDWYLGYSEWDGAGFTVVQPVSGPFAAYSRSAASTGLLMRYLDANGVEVILGADVRQITRVEVVARSVLSGGLSTDAAELRDAQDVTVRMRNR